MNARDTYIRKLRAQLDEWSDELDRLETRLKKEEANRDPANQEYISRLRQGREQMREKITQLQEASEDAWEDLKAGVEDTWNKLKDDFKKSRSHSA